MSEPPRQFRYQRFFAELKRRKVFRAMAMYGAAAFVVLQAAEILVEGLGLPVSVLRAIIIVTMIGFPITLGLAWAFEMGPRLGGIQLTDPPEDADIDAIVSQPRSRRWPSGLLALAGVVLLAVGVALMVDRLQSGDFDAAGRAAPAALDSADGSARAGASTVVAVVPFTVHGGAEFAYLGDGLVSLLGTKLDGAGAVRTVDPHAVMQVMERDALEPDDPASGSRIAAAFGADRYVVGDIFEAGGRLEIAASVYEVGTREPIAEAGVAGGEADMLDMVDDLTAQLMSGLSGGAAARVRRIAAVTTESLPALKAFFEGEELFRRGEFAASRASFEKAIAEDSTFAMAYYRLATVAEWSLQEDLSRWATARTEEHAGRLPERERRLLDAFLARKRGENLEAEQAYLSILGTYPDELDAWLDLAEVQFHTYPLYGRSMTESRTALEKVLEIDPEHSTALIHLARLSALEDRPEEVGDYIDRIPQEADRSLEMKLLRALVTGDTAAEASALDRFAEETDEALTLAVTAPHLTRRFDVAERLYLELTRPTHGAAARRTGWTWLANLAVAEGRWSDAMAAVDALEDSDPVAGLEHRALLFLTPFAPVTDAELVSIAVRLRSLDPSSVAPSNSDNLFFSVHDGMHPVIRLYLLGKIRARLGEADRALDLADELEAAETPAHFATLAPDLARGIRAEVLRKDGRSAEALATLESMTGDMWYLLVVASPIANYVPERFARAELLIEAGRDAEAEDWLAELGVFTAAEKPWLSPAWLLRAGIADRRGDAEAAAAHRAAFDRMWRNADESMRQRLP